MGRQSDRHPPRVLVVDDSADIRGMWRLWLTYWGFGVDDAGDGSEAVRKACEDPPDLILMDLWMPIVDGLEAIRLLRADARTAHVPIIAMSAQWPQIAAAREAGAETFLLKPCDPDALLKHIQDALHR